jgi:hypothetical protein
MRICSFCGKGESEVARLVTGGGQQPRGVLPAVAICNQCIALSCQILGGSTPLPPTEFHWKSFVHEGHGFEWTVLPQPDHTQLMVIKRTGTEKSIGWVIDANDVPTAEIAKEAIKRMVGYI